MENSKIEWTDHTFNPWIGCTKVSAGCTHCYAEQLMDKRYGRVVWGKGNPRQMTSKGNWAKPKRWNKEAEAKGIRYRVFCASLADVFDSEVPDEWREKLFELIFDTPNLDWLLLTKRPENVLPFMDKACFPSSGCPMFYDDVLPSNVWVGTSVENQEAADKRIPALLDIPASVRFLSCEPLLGAVDLRPWTVWEGQHEKAEWMLSRFGSSQPIDWVIVGGESGAGARPMQLAWARSLRDQCQKTGIAFLFKQWGEHIAQDYTPDLKGAIINVDGQIEVVNRVGKYKAGRELDGRTWDEFPTQPYEAPRLTPYGDLAALQGATEWKC